MSLTELLTSRIPAEVRHEGFIYSVSGAVRVDHGSESAVAATVLGKRPYNVEISLDGGSPRYACTCAYFETIGPCKHVWATLLLAGRKGHLLPAGESVMPPPLRTPAHWRNALERVENGGSQLRDTGAALPEGTRIIYVLDLAASRRRGALILQACAQRVKKSGKPARPAELRLERHAVSLLPDADDRLILESLLGALTGSEHAVERAASAPIATAWHLTPRAHDPLLARASRAGRLFAANGSDDALEPATWDDGPAWSVELRAVAGSDDFKLEAFLVRGTERIAARELRCVALGYVVLPDLRIAVACDEAAALWLVNEREHGAPRIPRTEASQAAATLLARHDVPRLELPAELAFRRIAGTPRTRLDVRPLADRDDALGAFLSFDYQGRVVPDGAKAPRIVDEARRELVERDLAAEAAARALLSGTGLQPPEGDAPWDVPVTMLSGVVSAAVRAGWRVAAHGKLYRAPGLPTISVVSGIDWFEVHGDVPFGEVSAGLPEILRASRRGEESVVLGDGSIGMLPDEWLARNGRWLALGKEEGGHLRFRENQAAILDALLLDKPEASCDETFTRVRKRLRAFDGVANAEQPAGFMGTMRDYQLAGLSWMHFLRDFGFGGCLADDMGTGKTAQVLALLESRRASTQRGGRRPSLVVVPRSLIFNWMEEAARFTPELKVVDMSHAGRDLSALQQADVGLITYGTLRRDAALLKDVELDYAILDEAQAIKNHGTASAKAARLLNARHRLIMTGTPVENHLGELWSLFEFINPGMLGSAAAFRPAVEERQELDVKARDVLARALRPFLLRRTKQQVAKELPARTEQTIHCDMSAGQRRHYREVRDRVRAQLLGRIDSEGIDKTRMHVLEALLRLRQIACHPALVDPTKTDEGSGKLDMLMEQLEQVADEGHKVLVFSQFTSFLDLVRARLNERGIVFEYLDGKTTDRAARVERFQNDPDCRVFLISLKAGGVGLNLTAADYVFLLDPWWNPAVEAQAIDRAHRIGQARRVFAYRLISSGTVEEQVLDLQQKKRDLADALLGDDSSLLGKLTREDIELLLS